MNGSKNKNGWVSLSFIFILIILISTLLIATAFNSLLHQEMSSDKICRVNQYEIMKFTKSQILLVFKLNPLAEVLYNAQMAMLPFIWIPKVYAVYKSIEDLRKSFDFLQKSIISFSNALLQFKSLKLYSDLYKNYKDSKNKFSEWYNLSFFLLPPRPILLRIRRKTKYIFPIYELESNFTEYQALNIFIKTKITPNLPLTPIINSHFLQTKNCKASLLTTDKKPNKVIFYNKNLLPFSW